MDAIAPAFHPWDHFFGGLAFLWLAVVAHVLRRQPGEKWPWAWLAWFGLLHAAGLWLDMLAGGQTTSPAWQTLRLAVAAGSLVALFEFGRRGIRHVGGRVWGNGVYAPLIGLVAVGALVVSLLNATAFCAAARLPAQLAAALCALLAASLLWLHGHRSPVERSRFFRPWQVPTAVVLAIAIGWASSHGRADRVEGSLATVTTSEAVATDQGAAGYVVVEVEPAKQAEPASRESLAIRRLRSGLPVLLVCLGLAAAVVTMWALSQRMH